MYPLPQCDRYPVCGCNVLDCMILVQVATRDFAKSANLPVINENCPACFEEPKERARIKEMLAREESLFPAMFNNIR
jgi:hypothetical protein